MKRKTMDKVPPAPKYRIWGYDEVLYGPIELLTLVDWIRQQRVGADTWVHSDQSRVWAEAGVMDELRPLLQDMPRAKAIQAANALRAGVNPEVLQRLKLLRGLTYQQITSFLDYMEILTLEPGAYAVKEGEHGDAMFAILEGEVRVQISRKNKDSILATLAAGDFFGEISLLDQGPRSADVIANDRSTLLKISAISFAKLRREAPALTEPLLHALGKNVVGRLRGLTHRYQESLLMLQSLSVT